MPAVLTIVGGRVVIYPNDHRPAHVHAVGADDEAVFNLHCPDGPPELRENYAISRGDIRRIRTALSDALARLCEEWSNIHGRP